MTGTHYMNLVAAVLIVAALAGACRIAFQLAGDRLDRRPALVRESVAQDDERPAA